MNNETSTPPLLIQHQSADSVICPCGVSPGVLATLSRWRSWVQIPSRVRLNSRNGTVRKPAKRPRPSFGRRPKFGDLWVRLPLVPVN